MKTIVSGDFYTKWENENDNNTLPKKKYNTNKSS